MTPKHRKNNGSDALLNCRICECFEMARISQPNFAPTRKMGICHAIEVILSPLFPPDIKEDSFVINKATESGVMFEVPDNCPKLEELRAKGIVPWANATIDFTNGRQK